MEYEIGQLIRWPIAYAIYEASPTGVERGLDPEYNYGIVLEISERDSCMALVHCYSKSEYVWHFVHLYDDRAEILNNTMGGRADG